jgi:hypothetical protein
MRYALLALGMMLTGGSAYTSTEAEAVSCGTCGSYLWWSTDVPKLYDDFATHAFGGGDGFASASEPLFLRASRLSDGSEDATETPRSRAGQIETAYLEACGGAEPIEGQACEHLHSSIRECDSHGCHSTHGPLVCSSSHASCESLAALPRKELDRLIRGGTIAQISAALDKVLEVREFSMDLTSLALLSCAGTVEVSIPLTSTLREALLRRAAS